MQYHAPHPCTVPAFKDKTCYAYTFESMGELAQLVTEKVARNSSSEPPSWYGNVTRQQAIDLCHTGDEARASASDQIMIGLEDLALDTSRAMWVDAIAGGFPNIPAYLSGSPVAMRRRIRDKNAAAPICIVADTTISAILPGEQITARGSAILALARLLSATRPVELWTLCAIDYQGRNGAGFYLVRIESAPLDLARAAYALTHPAYPRHLQYGLAQTCHQFRGNWPFANYNMTRANLRALITPYLPHADEILAIPGGMAADRIINNPKAWLAAALEEFGPQIEGA